MKEISIRELHRRTGKWVRDAKRHGAIVVTDRNVPIAKLTPIDDVPAVNPFTNWKPLKRFAQALDQPVSGRAIEEIILEDRER
jgi:prevent-host-death family protein